MNKRQAQQLRADEERAAQLRFIENVESEQFSILQRWGELELKRREMVRRLGLSI